jgi:hypothetical protein
VVSKPDVNRYLSGIVVFFIGSNDNYEIGTLSRCFIYSFFVLSQRCKGTGLMRIFHGKRCCRGKLVWVEGI